MGRTIRKTTGKDTSAIQLLPTSLQLTMRQVRSFFSPHANASNEPLEVPKHFQFYYKT